jgi:hypothetical protein
MKDGKILATNTSFKLNFHTILYKLSIRYSNKVIEKIFFTRYPDYR